MADALARIDAREGLAGVLEPVAQELRAAHVVVHERVGNQLVAVSATGEGDDTPIATPAMLAGGAVAIVRGGGPADPLAVADLHERGYGALLAVPVTRDGEIVGAVELYKKPARPWSRYDVRRARLTGHHVAAAMARLAALALD